VQKDQKPGGKRTIRGEMNGILTAEQMRLLEKTAMESGRVTGQALMQRAGEGVIAAALREWPALVPGVHHALILCGPGNNGGDGYVIARGLLRRGWQVRLCAVRAPKAGGDASAMAHEWRAAGRGVLPMEDCPDVLADLVSRAAGQPVIVFDAVLGIGQGRCTDDILAPWSRARHSVMKAAPDARLLAVAVDVPTGYDCDTGRPLGRHPFAADLVVTFHARKPVHAVLDRAGIRTVVVPIGL
jgi:NAD(P)H-hydrate epimerase